MHEDNPYVAPQSLKPWGDDAPGEQDVALLRGRYLYREITLRALAATKVLTVGQMLLYGTRADFAAEFRATLMLLAGFHALVALGLWRFVPWACVFQILSSGAVAAVGFALIAVGMTGGPQHVLTGSILLAVHGGVLYVVASQPTWQICRPSYRQAAARAPLGGTRGAFLFKLLLFVVGWFAVSISLLALTSP